jgi:uncharacterized protein (DUF433 family)
MFTLPESVASRLVRQPNGCLEWQGCRDARGYGQVRIKGIAYRVHRLVWAVAKGPIPPGAFITHSCDNPPCGDLAHLNCSNHDGNMREMRLRGRGPNVKLTEGQVQEIRMRYAVGEGFAALAPEYGVTRQAIYAIVNNRNWRHTAQERNKT